MYWNRRHRRGRPPHPDILTPAEWRVVELIRDGMPNAEIAVRLGITVRTVKSHVSSILAKTGLPDRYALAEWDGAPSIDTQQDDRRGARGLLLPLTGWLPSGVAKVVAGGLGAVVLVGAVVVAFAWFAPEVNRDGGDRTVPGTAPGGVPGSYLAGNVTSTNETAPVPERTLERFELWYADSGEWRHESERSLGALDRSSILIVHDGSRTASYDEGRTMFVEMEMDAPPITYGLGRDPSTPEVDSLDELVNQLSARLDWELQAVGADEVMGRRVEVFEDTAPVWAEVTRLRYYIDPASLTVMRIDMNDPGYSRTVEMVQFEEGIRIDPTLIAFPSPPAPAGSISNCVEPPDGEMVRLLSVERDGWSQESRSGFDCYGGRGLLRERVHYVRANRAEDGYLLFEQTRRPGAEVPGDLQGEPITVGAFPGWSSASAGGASRIAWAQQGVVAMLESDVLDVDELIEVARSARGGPVADLVSEQTGIEAVDAVLPLIVRGDYESVMEMRVLDMVECSAPPPGEAMTVPCLDGEPPGTEVEAFHSGSQCQSELVRNDEPGREQMLAGLSTIGAGTPVVLGMLSPEVAEAKGIEGPAYVVIFKTEEPRVRGYYVLISEDGVEGWDGGCGPVQFYVGTLAAEILLQ